jgi:hypothetical protein
MYLGDYVQESVHGKDPVTSTFGDICAEDVITSDYNTLLSCSGFESLILKRVHMFFY